MNWLPVNIIKLHPSQVTGEMMKIRFLPLLILMLYVFHPGTSGQDHHERFDLLDVQSYRFEITLYDTTDLIRVRERVKVEFRAPAEGFYLDLKNVNNSGKGMKVQRITCSGKQVPFLHRNNRLQLMILPAAAGETRSYHLSYQGIPADGLIISENKFGDRTFFGDNWPDRARHWLAVVDHPSDKARVEFIVNAPGHYGVVSNGTKTAETVKGGRITSTWKTCVPLPTKLMVIGVAPFAVQHLRSSSGIPVSSWVFPQNREEGFFDYSLALKPLDFFENYIGPYPFSKLANVQSKTVYGGMENAGCIFYRESSVTGKRDHETLLAHEIAHQWFGDAVSELNWHHIWLSEGFATYLTDLYLERVHGSERFLSSLLREKQQVLRYARNRPAPVIDTTLPVSVRLLNPNSYEKAGWVLHMLRGELGDRLFRESLRTFYQEYQYSNALTEDFRRIVDSISGENYAPFFRQWLYESGHPVISATWEYERGEIRLHIRQHQEQSNFVFPLDIKIVSGPDSFITETLRIDSRNGAFSIPCEERPVEIILDPESWLLFEYHDP
ncbi:MAG: M1 family metallopeptidase [Bacteroidales bacterium]